MNRPDLATGIDQLPWQGDGAALAPTAARHPTEETQPEPLYTQEGTAEVTVYELSEVRLTAIELEVTLHQVRAHCTACGALFPLPLGRQAFVCPVCAATTWSIAASPVMR